MAGNAKLTGAKKNKKDGFYTHLPDISNELRHCRDHFAGKTVPCNCDAPTRAIPSSSLPPISIHGDCAGLYVPATTALQSRQANHDAFAVELDDPVTGERTQSLRSSSSLSVEEMSACIDRFRRWASEQGIYLPDAHLAGDGDRMEFASEGDRQAFEQATVETGRLAKFL